jgi:hypothetical protein
MNVGRQEEREHHQPDEPRCEAASWRDRTHHRAGGKRRIEKQRRLGREWSKGLLADVKARRVGDVTDPKRLAISDRESE